MLAQPQYPESRPWHIFMVGCNRIQHRLGCLYERCFLERIYSFLHLPLGYLVKGDLQAKTTKKVGNIDEGKTPRQVAEKAGKAEAAAALLDLEARTARWYA